MFGIKKITPFFLFISSTISYGQTNFMAAREDSKDLTAAYMRPLTKMMILSAATGWYSDATVSKDFKFEFHLGANLSFANDSDKFFDISKLNLSGNTKIQDGVTKLPTVLASKNEATIRATYTTSVPILGLNINADFDLPKGRVEELPTGGVMTPIVQVGLSYLQTKVMVRYLPKIGTENQKMGYWGVGLQKEISPYLGIHPDHLLHISALGGYTRVALAQTLKPTKEISTTGTTDIAMNSYTAGIAASLDTFLGFYLYGGMLYNWGSATTSVSGIQNVTYSTDSSLLPSITLPSSSAFEIEEIAHSLSASIGIGWSFKIYTNLFANYTIQDRHSFSVGVRGSF